MKIKVISISEETDRIFRTWLFYSEFMGEPEKKRLIPSAWLRANRRLYKPNKLN